ncbi:hypothetical protein YC2023_096283 [Brassica napus]
MTDPQCPRTTSKDIIFCNFLTMAQVKLVLEDNICFTSTVSEARIGLNAGNHPDLHLEGWNNVKIDIWTHAVWKKLHIYNCSKNLVSQIFNNSKLFATNIHVLTLQESALHNNFGSGVKPDTKTQPFEFPTTELKKQDKFLKSRVNG